MRSFCLSLALAALLGSTKAAISMTACASDFECYKNLNTNSYSVDYYCAVFTNT